MEDYSLKDLLSLIDEEAPEREPLVHSEDDSEITRFCNEMSIYVGVDKIPNSVIYYTYSELFKGELSKIEFFRQFNKVFTQTRTGKQRRYLLDKESFDMSREGLIKVEFFEKERKESNKKK